MKQPLTTLIICLFTINGMAQSEKVDNIILDSVQTKLAQDTASYKQFLLLGKCKCADRVDSTNEFSTVYNELFYLWTPFTRLIGNVDGKQKLYDYLSQIIDSLYPKENHSLRARDEKIRKHSHSRIICDRIFSPGNNIWKYYTEFIRQKDVLIGPPHYLKEYLKDSSEVINNKGW